GRDGAGAARRRAVGFRDWGALRALQRADLIRDRTCVARIAGLVGALLRLRIETLALWNRRRTDRNARLAGCRARLCRGAGLIGALQGCGVETGAGLRRRCAPLRAELVRPRAGMVGSARLGSALPFHRSTHTPPLPSL